MPAAKKSSKSQITPEQFLQPYPDLVKRIAKSLQTLLLQTLPGVEEKVYPVWKGIGYHYKNAGYICGIFPQEDKVHLVFEQGMHLDDPDHLFADDAKERKQTRYVVCNNANNLPKRKLARLLKIAAVFGQK